MFSKALHRDVPMPHEIVGLGNFMPRVATNAEALIDYALSHIPPSKKLSQFFAVYNIISFK